LRELTQARGRLFNLLITSGIEFQGSRIIQATNPKNGEQMAAMIPRG
jgi:hypothetical protein